MYLAPMRPDALAQKNIIERRVLSHLVVESEASMVLENSKKAQTVVFYRNGCRDGRRSIGGLG